MKKLILLLFLFITFNSFSQIQKDSLVDIFDKNHKILKLNIHVNDLLKEMNNLGKDIYYIREKKEDGVLVECLYVKREEEFLSI